MSTRRLPDHPDLAQLHRLARDLQRGVRRGDPGALRTAALDAADPGYPLHRAQLALAREHGFAAWPRLVHHVQAIEARTWSARPTPTDEPAADRVLRLACLTWDGTPAAPHDAAALVGDAPGSVAVAAAAGRPDAVRALLAADPAAATRPVGPFGWSPLLYLAYSRLDTAGSVESAELLLDAGADPDDGRFFEGLPTPFTVLTGLLGGGEHAEPPHPHWRPLAHLLLARGADPNDGQALYNRMFDPDDEFLGVLFEHGLGRGDGGPWRRRLPDLLPNPRTLLRNLLGWAVAHDQRDRVALLAERGADVLSPLAGVGPLPSSATPLRLAIENGHRELADRLRALGATEPDLDPVQTFCAAVLGADADAVRAAPAGVVEAARTARPGLIVWAVGQGHAGAVRLLLELGWDVDALGRGDVPHEHPWETALHAAVERDDRELVTLLLDAGASGDVRDTRFDGTPRQWAEHLGRADLLPLLP